MRPEPVKVNRAPAPALDVNALYYGADSYDWIFEPREPLTKKDVCMPGYFNAHRDDLRVGTRITCRLGKIADGISEIELQVIECGSAPGDVMVSVKGRDGTFTPCRHDGTLEDDQEKVA